MNIQQMAALIGEHGHIREGDLTIQVEIINMKQAYGNMRALITPLAGMGETWVNLDRITLEV